MKLTFKLTLAFLLVSILAVGLAAAFIWGMISYEFNNYIQGQRQNQFMVAVSSYYQSHGSWDGVQDYLQTQGLLPPPTAVNPPPQPYVLADSNRVVWVASPPYAVGDKLRRGDIDKGVSVVINGQTVGMVVSTGKPLAPQPLEQKYMDQINQALWIAGLGGVLLALVLGLWIARSLTRPIREITKATHDMAQGKLDQRVPVRSRDELGELAQSFNRMSADLAHANQSRRQMTADIAHDLRNPLTVIGGYLESLQDGKLDPTPERFQVMHAEVQHLQHLVDDLRVLSLADAGELKLHLQPVTPGDLLTHVAATYAHQADQQNIKLALDIEAGLTALEMDSERMEQVLGNLVGNALGYTPQGGEITLSAKQADQNLVLCVRDNGRGIPPEALPHIFERSYRGDSSRSGEGSGLGLAIAKSIVELHGGKIWAESDSGGSRFFIMLADALKNH